MRTKHIVRTHTIHDLHKQKSLFVTNIGIIEWLTGSLCIVGSQYTN